MNFDVTSNGDLQHRTNNLIEAFHYKINNLVEYYHPMVSILVEKLKDLSIKYYHNYVGKLFNNVDEIKNSSNVFYDIYNFLEKFLNKYDKTLNINLLTQDEGETKLEFNQICNNVLKYLYNFKGFKNDKIDDEIYSDNDEGINDFVDNWWNNDLINKSKKDNDSDAKEMDKDDSFNIDPETILKKRNYNYIKFDLINKFYEEEKKPIKFVQKTYKK